MTDQTHNRGAPFGSRSSAKRALIRVPDMMPSQRAAVPHAARAQNDGLCKGKLNRASAESCGEYHHYAAVTGRVTSKPDVMDSSVGLLPRNTLVFTFAKG